MAVFRAVAWVLMAGLVAISRHQLVRPWPTLGLLGLALAITVVLWVWERTAPERLLRPGVLAVELACGVTLVVSDGWVFGPGHAFSTAPALGVAWPLAAVLSVGLAAGPRPGLAAGILVGAARVVATLLNGVHMHTITGNPLVSLATTTVLYTMAGGVAGYVSRLLVRAEEEIAAARARQDVTRTLHDGVLQTLAVVERRTDDPELAALARRQEQELRDYLFGLEAAHQGSARRRGGTDPGTTDRVTLVSGLRQAARRFEEVFPIPVEILVAPDVPALSSPVAVALCAALGEALTNAGKHAAASRITVYCEPDDGPETPGGGAPGRIFLSVKDDGVGFDPSTVPEGIGLSRSIRGRLDEVGGRVEITSRPGAGTEVRLWA
jgi:signal transduction histidine kinase